MYILPDKNHTGRYGVYGGQYVPETLMPAIHELEKNFFDLIYDKEFQDEFNDLLINYVGRETPLYYAQRLTEHFGKGKIYLKREDLNHTGAHKINNALGQALIAKRLGKKRIIAETGAGQHGVATATACALVGLDCEVYMGSEDIRRQESNVFRMKLLGAKVNPVTKGQKTLKEATSEAIRDWVTNIDSSHYILGSASGPHPYPLMVRTFQSVIGVEARKQILEKENKLPTHVLACVGGGSNAIGIYAGFIDEPEVKLIGLEAGGDAQSDAATLTDGTQGVLHGTMSYLLQDEFGRIQDVHSISAGLDYPGVGPEHALLKDNNRVQYHAVTDQQALEGFKLLTRIEGIIPALESSHAIAHLFELMPKTTGDDIIIVNLSGRGDKDIPILKEYIDI